MYASSPSSLPAKSESVFHLSLTFPLPQRLTTVTASPELPGWLTSGWDWPMGDAKGRGEKFRYFFLAPSLPGLQVPGSSFVLVMTTALARWILLVVPVVTWLQ